MSDIELLNEKKSKEVLQKPTNEQKSLLQLIRSKRAENEKILKDNESRKKEVENLKSENVNFDQTQLGISFSNLKYFGREF